MCGGLSARHPGRRHREVHQGQIEGDRGGGGETRIIHDDDDDDDDDLNN